MDRATLDKITRDTAGHKVALARRDEAFGQEFKHRRLMMGLERFHEFELTRIRKGIVDPTDADLKHGPAQPEIDPRTTLVEPRGNRFKQVAEDGSDAAEPLYLRVVWVDSDSGGLFKWTQENSEGDGGKERPNGEMSEVKKGKMKEREGGGNEASPIVAIR